MAQDMRGKSWETVLEANEWFDGEPEFTLDALQRWMKVNSSMVTAKHRATADQLRGQIEAMYRSIGYRQ